MNCPYCNWEMEEGYIQSPIEIFWNKGSKRHILGRSELHENAVMLSKYSFVKGSAVRSYLCRNCKKVIIDYSEKTSDFNVR